MFKKITSIRDTDKWAIYMYRYGYNPYCDSPLRLIKSNKGKNWIREIPDMEYNGFAWSELTAEELAELKVELL